MNKGKVMSYFSKDFIDFFADLKKNNNRDWFQLNKERYLYSVKMPFEIFIQELLNHLYEMDETILPLANDAIFRIYRDVRFSSDKSPYKTTASAIISSGGKKDYTVPGFYLEFNNDCISVFMGAYFLDSKQLYKVRKSIKNNLVEFNQIINEKQFKRKFGKVVGDKNKVIQKEFRELALTQPLIMNKQFYCTSKLEAMKILSPKLLETIKNHYLVSRDFRDFLIDAIKR